jgi:hypothetical protein
MSLNRDIQKIVATILKDPDSEIRENLISDILKTINRNGLDNLSIKDKFFTNSLLAQNNKIGINTLTPNQNLDVSGNVNISNKLFLNELIVNNIINNTNIDISGITTTNKLFINKPSNNNNFNLDVSGSANITGSIYTQNIFSNDISNNNIFSNKINVNDISGNNIVSNNILNKNNIDICGNLTVYGKFIYKGIDGGEDFNDFSSIMVLGTTQTKDLLVSENANIYGDLDISGNVRLKNNIDISGELNINDLLIVKNNQVIINNLVNPSSSIENIVSTKIAINRPFITQYQLDVSGIINTDNIISKNGTFTENVLINQDLIINGNLNAINADVSFNNLDINLNLSSNTLNTSQIYSNNITSDNLTLNNDLIVNNINTNLINSTIIQNTDSITSNVISTDSLNLNNLSSNNFYSLNSTISSLIIEQDININEVISNSINNTGIINTDTLISTNLIDASGVIASSLNIDDIIVNYDVIIKNNLDISGLITTQNINCVDNINTNTLSVNETILSSNIINNAQIKSSFLDISENAYINNIDSINLNSSYAFINNIDVSENLNIGNNLDVINSITTSDIVVYNDLIVNNNIDNIILKTDNINNIVDISGDILLHQENLKDKYLITDQSGYIIGKYIRPDSDYILSDNTFEYQSIESNLIINNDSNAIINTDTNVNIDTSASLLTYGGVYINKNLIINENIVIHNKDEFIDENNNKNTYISNDNITTYAETTIYNNLKLDSLELQNENNDVIFDIKNNPTNISINYDIKDLIISKNGQSNLLTFDINNNLYIGNPTIFKNNLQSEFFNISSSSVISDYIKFYTSDVATSNHFIYPSKIYNSLILSHNYNNDEIIDGSDLSGSFIDIGDGYIALHNFNSDNSNNIDIPTLFLNSNKRIGVLTNSPQYTFDIVGDLNVNNFIRTNNLFIPNNNNDNYNFDLYYDNNILYFDINNYHNNLNLPFYFRKKNNDNLSYTNIIYVDSNNNISFNSNTTNNNFITFGKNILFENIVSSINFNNNSINNDSNNNLSILNSSSNSSLTLFNAGNIDINNTSTQNSLNIFKSNNGTGLSIDKNSGSSSAFFINNSGSGNAAKIVHSSNSSEALLIENYGSGDCLRIIDNTSDTSLFRVDSAGNVGIGLSSSNLTESFHSFSSSGSNNTNIRQNSSRVEISSTSSTSTSTITTNSSSIVLQPKDEVYIQRSGVSSYLRFLPFNSTTTIIQVYNDTTNQKISFNSAASTNGCMNLYPLDRRVTIGLTTIDYPRPPGVLSIVRSSTSHPNLPFIICEGDFSSLGSIDINSKGRIINCINPINNQDVATKSYVDAFLTNNNNFSGINTFNTTTNGYTVFNSGSTGTSSVYIYKQNAGSGLYLNTSSVAKAIFIDNNSTNNSIHITHNNSSNNSDTILIEKNVGSGDAINITDTGSSGNNFEISRSGGNGNILNLLKSGSGTGSVINISNSSTTNGNSIRISHAGSQEAVFIENTGSSDCIRIADQSSDTSFFRIDSAGRVGIGVDSNTLNIANVNIIPSDNTIPTLRINRNTTGTRQNIFETTGSYQQLNVDNSGIITFNLVSGSTSSSSVSINIQSLGRIINCLNPIDNQDVATKSYVDTNGGSAILPTLNTFSNINTFSSGTNSNNISSGSIVISNNGGLGVSGKINASNIHSTGRFDVSGNSSISNGCIITDINGNIDFSANRPVRFLNTTTSSSITSGAIVVSGGIGVSGAIFSSIIDISGNNSDRSLNITHSSSNPAIQINNSSTDANAFGLNITGANGSIQAVVNSGSNRTANFENTSSGNCLRLKTTANAGKTLEIIGENINSSVCVEINKTGNGSGNVLDVSDAGTGISLQLNKSNNGRVIDINKTSSGSGNSIRISHNGSQEAVFIENTGSSDCIRIADQSSDTSFFRIDNSGNVGIGVDSNTLTNKFISIATSETTTTSLSQSNTSLSLIVNNSSVGSSRLDINDQYIQHAGRQFISYLPTLGSQTNGANVSRFHCYSGSNSSNYTQFETVNGIGSGTNKFCFSHGSGASSGSTQATLTVYTQTSQSVRIGQMNVSDSAPSAVLNINRDNTIHGNTNPSLSFTGTNPTDNIIMNCNNGIISNVMNPVNNQDVATKYYVDSNGGTLLLSSNNTFTGINTFSNSTASTSTSTGALVVSGGVGISGRINVVNDSNKGIVLQKINVPSSLITIGATDADTNQSISLVTPASSDINGSGFGRSFIRFDLSGSSKYDITSNRTNSSLQIIHINSLFNQVHTLIDISRNLITFGSTLQTLISNTTASTSKTTGALVVSGGLGVTGNICASGIFIGSNSNNSDLITSVSNVNSNNIFAHSNQTGDIFCQINSSGAYLTIQNASGSPNGCLRIRHQDATTSILDIRNSDTNSNRKIAFTNNGSTTISTINIFPANNSVAIGNLTPSDNSSTSTLYINKRTTTGDTLTLDASGGVGGIQPILRLRNSGRTGLETLDYGEILYNNNSSDFARIRMYDITTNVTGNINGAWRGRISFFTQNGNGTLPEVLRLDTDNSDMTNIYTYGRTNISNGCIIANNNGNIDFSANRPVRILNNTASSSTTTGALIITGGLGISGAIYSSIMDISGNNSNTSLNINHTSSNTNPAIQITNSATSSSAIGLNISGASGNIQAIVNTGSNRTANFENTATGNCMRLRTSANAGKTLEIIGENTNSSVCVEINKSGSGNGNALNISDAGSGTGIVYSKTGNGIGLQITQNVNNSNPVLQLLRNIGDGDMISVTQSGTISGKLLNLQNTNASNSNQGIFLSSNGTGNKLQIDDTGTSSGLIINKSGNGDALFINKTAGGYGLNIECTANTNQGLRVVKSGGNSFNVLFEKTTNTIDENVIINTTSGSGICLSVQNEGTGDCIRVRDQAGSDTSLFRIDADGNVGVGVGTGTLSNKVEILDSGTGLGLFVSKSNNANAVQINKSAGTGSGLAIFKSAGSDPTVYIENTSASDCLRIADVTSDTTLFRIDEDGRVGIGVGTGTLTNIFESNGSSGTITTQITQGTTALSLSVNDSTVGSSRIDFNTTGTTITGRSEIIFEPSIGTSSGGSTSRIRMTTTTNNGIIIQGYRGNAPSAPFRFAFAMPASTTSSMNIYVDSGSSVNAGKVKMGNCNFNDGVPASVVEIARNNTIHTTEPSLLFTGTNPSNNIIMNCNNGKISNVADPTASNEVATKNYVDSNSVLLNNNNTFTGINTFNNTTASSSTTTGAVIINGGLGVSGNLFCNAIGSQFDARSSGNVGTLKPSDISAKTVEFGFGVYNNTNGNEGYADIIHFNNWDNYSGGNKNVLMLSRSSSFGMRIFKGGYDSTSNYTDYRDVLLQDINGSITLNSRSIDISSNIDFSSSKIIRIHNTTASSSTTTGALVISGGLGVQNNVNIGGNVSISNSLNSNVCYIESSSSDTNSRALRVVCNNNGRALDVTKNASSSILATFLTSGSATGRTVEIINNNSGNTSNCLTVDSNGSSNVVEIFANGTGRSLNINTTTTNGGIIRYNRTIGSTPHGSIEIGSVQNFNSIVLYSPATSENSTFVRSFIRLDVSNNYKYEFSAQGSSAVINCIDPGYNTVTELLRFFYSSMESRVTLTMNPQFSTDILNIASYRMFYRLDENFVRTSISNPQIIALDILQGVIKMGISYTIGTSDKRIKKNIVQLDDNESYNIVKNIDIVKYDYIDIVKKPEQNIIGFIAQNIKQYIPSAIVSTEDFIPNIYKLLDINIINNNSFSINIPNDINLSDLSGNNQEIKFYDYSNKEYIGIISNKEENILTIDISNNISEIDYSNNKLFIYGVKIQELLNINKDRIFAVFASATQQLIKDKEISDNKINNLQNTIQEQQLTIQNLQNTIQNQQQLIENLQNQINSILTRLN